MARQLYPSIRDGHVRGANVSYSTALQSPATDYPSIPASMSETALPLQPVSALPAPAAVDGIRNSIALPSTPSASTAHLSAPNPSQGSMPPPSASRKKKGGRSGAPNYSIEDIEAMLDAVEDVEPLGANQWAIVEQQFNEWSTANERPYRDMDSLKLKFDKLASVKKPTGDPSCPANVRRAKRIAQNILGKCNAHSVGDSSSSDDDEKFDSFGNSLPKDSSPDDDKSPDSAEKKRKASKTLGARKNKRRPGVTGLKKEEHGDDPMMEHVGLLSQSMDMIAKVLTSRHGAESSAQSSGSASVIEIADIKRIVNEEVHAELKSTNDSIDEIKQMMKSFMNGGV